MGRITKPPLPSRWRRWRLYRDVYVSKNRRHHNRIYPHDQMDVGESYVIRQRRFDGEVKRHYDSAIAHGKRTGKKFIIRKVEECFVIWRIK